MLRKPAIVFLIVIMSLFISISTSYATCLKTQVTGNWNFYLLRADPDKSTGWERMLVPVKKNNQILGGTTIVNEKKEKCKIVSGYMQLKSSVSCLIMGRIKVKCGKKSDWINFRGTMYKNTIHGVWDTKGLKNGVGTFSAVKSPRGPGKDSVD